MSPALRRAARGRKLLGLAAMGKIPAAGRVAIACGVLTLVLGLLTACGPDPAGSGGLVGRMTATSDVGGVPGGDPVSGGGLAILPIAVMDGPFWELTGTEPLADPQEWSFMGATLSESDVSELGARSLPSKRTATSGSPPRHATTPSATGPTGSGVGSAAALTSSCREKVNLPPRGAKVLPHRG